MLDVSVVTINHHHSGIIENCIESLARLPDRASRELLIVDNTPADGLGAWVAGRFPNVSLHANEAPRGYAANANFGLQMAAGGRYEMMLNPDVICRPGMLDVLVEYMDRHAHVGLAAPKLLNLDGTLQPSCRAFPTPLTLALRFSRLDRFLGNSPAMRRYLMTDWDHSASAAVDWVTGAVMIFRREALQDAGYMDERYFMYWEDLDLCLRLWHGGWQVGYVPEAQATHAHLRQGVRDPFSKFARWQIRGALRIFSRFGRVPSRS